MSNDGVSIPAPLFVTWYQCIVTALICWVAGKIGERYQSTTYQKVSQSENGDSPNIPAQKQSFFSQFPKTEYKVDVARKVFPLSVIFVGMITFNNLCLKWVEVSFYNVARSLTIVFNVFFTWCLLGMGSSCKTSACLGVVILGFMLGSWGEINFSLRGTVAGILSSLFVSLNSIFTKGCVLTSQSCSVALILFLSCRAVTLFHVPCVYRIAQVLPAVEDNHWKLTYYNNINACVLFIPLMLYYESSALVEAMNAQLVSPIFWSAMTVAGVFGFSIGIVTVLQIKATSPLSHNISGTAKAAVQSMLAFYIWGNKATVMGVLGIFVVLGGSLLYTLVKMNENHNVAPPPSQEKPDSSQKV